MPCKKCGACCIAPSITTAIPNMPYGKPAGVRCVNLSDRNECTLFGRPERPTFCLAWPPTQELCGDSFRQAMRSIADLESRTGQRSSPVDTVAPAIPHLSARTDAACSYGLSGGQNVIPGGGVKGTVPGDGVPG